MSSKIENFLGHRIDGRKSRLPARLDWWQSASGLVLGLFMWGHMIFVSSVLISPQFFEDVSRFFEGSTIFGAPQPWLVTCLAVVIFVIFIIHAGLAMRKLPITWRQYQIAREHSRLIKHEDTTLWVIQAGTGFLMFFFASAHLGVMAFHPETIGFHEGISSFTRMQAMWPFYLILLFAVELHGGIGLYRLCVKWGWFDESGDEKTSRERINNVAAARARRKKLKVLKWAISVFFIALGLANLAVFIKTNYPA